LPIHTLLAAEELAQIRLRAGHPLWQANLLQFWAIFHFRDETEVRDANFHFVAMKWKFVA